MKLDYDRIAQKAFHFPSLITDEEALILNERNKGNEFWWLPKKNKHENRPDNQNSFKTEPSL